MDWHEIADQAGHASAILTAIGLAAALVWGAVKARADWKHATVEEKADERDAAAHELTEAEKREEAERKSVQDLLAIKDEMITALKEDREELREQLRRSLDREQKAAARITELERRLSNVEQESRSAMVKVLEAVVDSDRCARPDCTARIIPGDRREGDPVSI